MPTSLLDSFKEQNPVYSVLLVDDNPDDIRYITIILEHAGYHVINAKCAQDALKILEVAAPDIILSDLNMPGMDGIEFCRRVYLNDAYLQIPFVFISAIHDKLFKTQAAEAGAIDYICKPFSQEELLTKITEVLNLVHKNNLTDVLFVACDITAIKDKQSYLRQNGIVVTHVDTAKKALESIHTQKFNLIICEPQLTDMSALEFCKLLKKDAFKKIPFITYSEHVTSNMYSEGIKFGVNDFWNSGYTARELSQKIQSYLRMYGAERNYPKGISRRLDDTTVLEATQRLALEKQTGIMAILSPETKGHIHFNQGDITDAYVEKTDGISAFYTLMTIGRGGFFRFITTEENSGSILETPQNLFLYAEKLNAELKNVWEEVVIINNTFNTRPAGMQGLFIDAADGKKKFADIIKELKLDAYRGYLIFEKLIEAGKVISPVKEMLLMEFNNV